MRQRRFDDFLGNKPAVYAKDLIKQVGVRHPPVDPRVLADFRGYKIREVSAEDYPQFPWLKGVLRTACAFLVRPIRTILVHRDMHRLKKRNSSFHEIGHDILPHHDGLNYSCNEKSVDLAVKLAEQEAFLAGGHLILPPHLFMEDAVSFQLGVSAIKQLAQRYDAPLETVAMFYARMSGRRCAMIVAEPPSTNGSQDPQETPRRMGQIEFPFHIPRRVSPPSAPPPLVVKYFVKSALFPHFIFPGTPINGQGLVLQSWKADSPITGEMPAWDLGVNSRHLKYFAECLPFGLPGQRKVLVLLWLADHQLMFVFSNGGRS